MKAEKSKKRIALTRMVKQILRAELGALLKNYVDDRLRERRHADNVVIVELQATIARLKAELAKRPPVPHDERVRAVMARVEAES